MVRGPARKGGVRALSRCARTLACGRRRRTARRAVNLRCVGHVFPADVDVGAPAKCAHLALRDNIVTVNETAPVASKTPRFLPVYFTMAAKVSQPPTTVKGIMRPTSPRTDWRPCRSIRIGLATAKAVEAPPAAPPPLAEARRGIPLRALARSSPF